MSRMPVVGISSYAEPVDREPWVQQPSVVLPQMYARQVQDAGGLVVVLPPRLDADLDMAAQVLSRLDALIIAGGADIEPARYGQEPHPTLQPGRPDRDAWELALAYASAQSGLPTLGICRGMQIMAVAAGGALEQHLPDRTRDEAHLPDTGSFAGHPVTAVAGTKLADILGTQEMSVPTYHHQAVAPDSLGESAYVPAAWHTDGTLEAIEDPTAPFRLAVQWHPEAGDDPRLFQALIAAAGRA